MIVNHFFDLIDKNRYNNKYHEFVNNKNELFNTTKFISDAFVYFKNLMELNDIDVWGLKCNKCNIKNNTYYIDNITSNLSNLLNF